MVSAVTGEGVPELLAAMDTRFAAHDEIVAIDVPAGMGALISWLHENAEVIARETDETGATHYKVRVDAERKARLEAKMRSAT